MLVGSCTSYSHTWTRQRVRTSSGNGVFLGLFARRVRSHPYTELTNEQARWVILKK